KASSLLWSDCLLLNTDCSRSRRSGRMSLIQLPLTGPTVSDELTQEEYTGANSLWITCGERDYSVQTLGKLCKKTSVGQQGAGCDLSRRCSHRSRTGKA